MSNFELIAKFMCPDNCLGKYTLGKPICEKCKDNLKKFNHLPRLFLECKRLEIKLDCPCLHKTMFNRLAAKLLALDEEAANLVKEPNLEGMKNFFIDYLITFPKYVAECKKEKCEECGELIYGGDCDCYCEGCGIYRPRCIC